MASGWLATWNIPSDPGLCSTSPPGGNQVDGLPPDTTYSCSGTWRSLCLSTMYDLPPLRLKSWESYGLPVASRCRHYPKSLIPQYPQTSKLVKSRLVLHSHRIEGTTTGQRGRAFFVRLPNTLPDKLLVAPPMKQTSPPQWKPNFLIGGVVRGKPDRPKRCNGQLSI